MRTAELAREKMIREHAALLLSVLDNLGDGVVVADEGANLVYFNSAAERILGPALTHSPITDLPRRCGMYLPDDVAPCPPEALPLLRAVGGEPSDQVELIVGSDGKPASGVRLSITARPLVDELGNLRGGLMVLRDITESRRAEAALRHSEHLLDLFFSQSLDGFFFMMLDQPVRWDDGVDKDAALEYIFSHQRITKVNDAMLAQYGASREQFIGLRPRDFYAHDIEYGKKLWRQFFDAGRLHTETDERRFDGTPIRIEGDYLCLYSSDGRIAGHFGIQRNVTERHRAEQRVRRSRRELRALAARLQSVREKERRRIAGEIHDELGQALTAFKIDLAWLAGRLRSDQSELIQQVASMLGRVDETVGTVRRIATELRPSVLDNLGVVAAIEWQASEFEKRTGIKLTLDLPPDSLDLDDGRATTVFRMVQETLTNVARHSRASEAAITLELEDGTLVLEVSDNGRGIGEEESHGTSSLGLVGLRERALACGGTLGICGVPGQGTTITARIPLAAQTKKI